MVVTCSSNDIVLKKDDIIIINPKEVHSAVAGKDGVLYCCIMFELAPYVNNRYFGQSYIKPLLFRQMRFKNLIHDEQILQLMDSIRASYYQDNLSTAPLHIEANVLSLLALLIEKYINEEADTTQGESDMRFTEILDYIDTHFTENMQISDLAQRFGYNKSYFCRKFKNQTGITCIEYISALRLDYAAIMLKGTPYSISEVSEKCGYLDANYFSRCFKEKYGVSPAEWKKDQKM